MVTTNLIAGAAVPVWDRELLAGLLAAAQGEERDLSIRRMAVMNGNGMVYRQAMADGQREFVLLLRFSEARGFEMYLRGGEIVASLDGAKPPSTA